MSDIYRTRIQELADAFDPSVHWPSEGPNPIRSQRAAFALAHVEEFYEFDEDYGLADFLADFMHLCDALGVPFEGVLDGARRHHDDEVLNPNP